MNYAIPISFLRGLAGGLAAGRACADSASLRLFDGRIHTMDQRDTVVSEVTIQHGRFAYVGPVRNARLDPCTKSTDLHGRTAVPGLIDNHNHIVLLGMRPGHDVRIETTGSIAEIQAILKEKAKTVSTGEWVTTLGDFNVRQFTENRLPKLSELDQALPGHPYIMNGGGGTATNSLGKAFFESKGITVSPDGVIANVPPFLAALNTLRALQTFADQKRGTTEANRGLRSAAAHMSCAAEHMTVLARMRLK